MTGFDATPAQLQATAAQLSQLGDEARSELGRLAADAAALLDGWWRGQAALGFQRGWTQCSAGALESLDALEAMARLLRMTGQRYAAAETDSARVLDGVGGQL